MSRRQQPDRRILVIANRTCPCLTLADDVARRASDTPIDVRVVAPALNSRLRHWVSDVDEALASFAAEEIVIATHPPGQSNWLERRLIEKARARFDVPITHLVSNYGLVEEGSPA
jgi:hypothetical protein